MTLEDHSLASGYPSMEAALSRVPGVLRSRETTLHPKEETPEKPGEGSEG